MYTVETTDSTSIGVISSDHKSHIQLQMIRLNNSLKRSAALIIPPLTPWSVARSRQIHTQVPDGRTHESEMDAIMQVIIYCLLGVHIGSPCSCGTLSNDMRDDAMYLPGISVEREPWSHISHDRMRGICEIGEHGSR